MDEDVLEEKTEQLVTELYGQGSPVSDEQVEDLIAAFRSRRRKFARALVKSMELTKLSREELEKELSVEFEGSTIKYLDPDFPEGGYVYLERLVWACQKLHSCGYEDRLPGLLYEPIIEGFLREDPKVSILESVRSGFDPMRTLVFLEEAD